MSVQPGSSLLELLYDQKPDVNRIIDTFITRFNAVYGNPEAVLWDISKEEWQRYEFLGDRVLNLIIAQNLFTRRDGLMNEGEMSRVLASVVSNRALDALSRDFDKTVLRRMVPQAIGEKASYGKRVTGGAFEAFIGALYCEVGLDDVMFFVTAITKNMIDAYDPRENAIGILQEYFQKQGGHLPIYEETSRTGPDHLLHFTVRVRIADGRTFDSSGLSLSEARMAAARKALDEIGWKP